MLIDGKKIAEEIQENIQVEVSKLPFKPVFCDVLVGDDAASKQYVSMKAKTAERLGFEFRIAEYPASITTENLINEIKKINQEPNMCGLIVQLPLPVHLDKQAVLDAIDSKIDVDCTGKENTELFYQGSPYVEFPTAAAVMELLASTEVNLKDKKCLVVGQGQLVGKPVSFLLKQKALQVDIAYKKTENIEELLKNADVIVSAVGKPKLIVGNNIKPGCIVIDAGTAESEGGISGDVDWVSVKDIASFLSPVPGGVGPVTVAKLLANVLKVASIKAKQSN